MPGRSTILRLVRYHNIFGQVDYLVRPEAEAKLARELVMYRRWMGYPDPPVRVTRPYIEEPPFR